VVAVADFETWGMTHIGGQNKTGPQPDRLEPFPLRFEGR
jgi:hypothetical protein